MASERDSPAEATTVDIGSPETHDSFDRVLKQVVGGNRHHELAPGDVIGGSFRIVRLIGAGGMGTVYVARDQRLGRDVAIKLHHTAGGAFRLEREAIAMARLAHPNVVTVYEVGELDDHPFVVMEYVPGTTLRAWLAAEPRSVKQIVDILAGAGAGLAAAHDAGLLHRDIKPDNVLIGADGRARVGDFGLAREVDSKDDAPAGGAERMLSPVTQTGAMLGTPAYMAPEQLTTRAIDARADQFAFCVMLWEALWKERPFSGNTFDELVAAVAEGKRRAPPPSPKVPPRIRAALERGLSTDPAGRFASMHALLAALREPVRTRALAAGAAALVIVAAGGAWLLSRESHVSCEHAGDRFAAMVPREAIARLRAAGAGDAAKHASAALDHFSATLAAAGRRSCEAGRAHHEWTPELVEKSEACLTVAAQAARQLLAPDAPVSDVVRFAAFSLPEVASCTSPTFLAASPRVDIALTPVLADYTAAVAEAESYAIDRAAPLIARIESSPLRDSPLVAPRRLVLQALLSRSRGDAALEEKQLSDAYYAARALDDDGVVTTALTRLLYLATEKDAADPSARAWLRTALADGDRIASRTPLLAARLYLSAARLADAAGDSTTALAHIAKLRTLAQPDDPITNEATFVEAGVLMWSGKVDDGVKLYEAAIAAAAQRVGSNHPAVGSMLADYAESLLEAGRTPQALDVARRALAIIEQTTDPSDRLVDYARVNLAAVLGESGDEAQAQPLLETARAHYVAHYGVRSTMVANVDMNLALSVMSGGDTARAIELLDESLATSEELLGKDRIEVAEILYNLAAAHRTRNELPTALAAARRCADIYGAKRPGVDRHRTALAMVAAIANQLHDYPTALAATATGLAFTDPPQNFQALAWLQLERGRALLATHHATDARPLLAAARAAYAANDMTDRVHEIDGLEP